MLAMDFIKTNRETVENAIRDKGVNLDLDQLLALDGEARALKTEIDTLRAERNRISDCFKEAAPEEKAALGAQAKAAGARASELEAELGDKNAALKGLMLKLPGIPWDGAPVGPDESFNTVVRQEGAIPNFTFEPLDHVALIERNDWADLSRITPVSGSRTSGRSGAPAGSARRSSACAPGRVRAPPSRSYRKSPARNSQRGRDPAPCGSTRRSGCTRCGAMRSNASRSASDSRTRRNCPCSR